MDRKRDTTSERNAKGFTLVELLVAMAISSFVIIGIYQVLIHQMRQSTAQERTADAGRAGQYAIERVARDLRMAGFLLGPPWGVEVVQANFDGTGVKTLDNLNSSPYLGSHDAIFIRMGEGTVLKIADHVPGMTNLIVCESTGNLDGWGYKQGRFILLRSTADAIKVAKIDSIAAGSDCLTPGCSGGCAQVQFTDQPSTFTPVGPVNATFDEGLVAHYFEVAYYIKQASGRPVLHRQANTFYSGSSDPSLRQEAEEVEIAENIEDLQLEFMDDGNVVLPKNDPSESEIRSVRVSLAAVSETSQMDGVPCISFQLSSDGPLLCSSGASDRRIRRVFRKDVRIRNYPD